MAKDVHLKPHECKHIRIEGQLSEDKEWLVQKNLLANTNNSHFTMPNTLISTSNPWIPIANPTDQPRYIHKGEIIRILEDPSEFFETSVTAERREVLTSDHRHHQDTASRGQDYTKPRYTDTWQ